MKKTFINPSYLVLASICLLGYILDPIFVLIQEKHLGCSIVDWSSDNLVSHWIVMTLIWLFISMSTLTIAHRLNNLDVVRNKWTLNSRNAIWTLTITIFSVLVIFIIKRQFGFVYAIKHWQIIYIALYAYYLAEILVAICFVCLLQNYCELNVSRFKKFPWGGLFLGLTWGLMHWWTQQSLAVGAIGVVLGLLFGLLYVLFECNFILTYIICFCLFVCL